MIEREPGEDVVDLPGKLFAGIELLVCKVGSLGCFDIEHAFQLTRCFKRSFIRRLAEHGAE